MQYDLRSPARRHLGSRNLLSRPAYKVPWLIVSSVGANLYLTQHLGLRSGLSEETYSLVVFSRIGDGASPQELNRIYIYYPLDTLSRSF